MSQISKSWAVFDSLRIAFVNNIMVNYIITVNPKGFNIFYCSFFFFNFDPYVPTKFIFYLQRKVDWITILITISFNHKLF